MTNKGGPLAAQDVPWLVELLWPVLERLGNSPEPGDPDWLAIETRHRLELLIAGHPPVPDAACRPPLVLVSRGEVLEWGLPPARTPPELSEQVRFGLLLLWHSPARFRVARCRSRACLRFFLRPEVRGRPRESCSDDCARAAHRAYVRDVWRPSVAGDFVRARPPGQR